MIKAVHSLLIAMALIAAGPVRSFTIAGEPFNEADIVDARMQPNVNGVATVLVTLEERAAARFAKLTGDHLREKLPIMLDGKLLSEPVVMEAITGGAFEISGSMSVREAVALAKRISGKDPLPDSLDDGP
jgi:preprotein translocase subunit SecD